MTDFDIANIDYNSDEKKFYWQGEEQPPDSVRDFLLDHIERNRVTLKSGESYIRLRYSPPGAMGHPISEEALKSLTREEPAGPSPPGPEPMEADLSYINEGEYGSRDLELADDIEYMVDVPLSLFLATPQFFRRENKSYFDYYLDKSDDIKVKEIAIGTSYRSKSTGQYVGKNDDRVRPLRMNSFYIDAQLWVITEGGEKLERNVKTNKLTKGRGRPPLPTWDRVYEACWEDLITKLDDMTEVYDHVVVEFLKNSFRRYTGAHLAG